MIGHRVREGRKRTSFDAIPKVLNISNAEVESGADGCSTGRKKGDDGDGGGCELHV